MRNAMLAWEYGDDLVHAVALITTELVTNVLRHAPATRRGVVQLGIWLDGLLMIEVFDQETGTPAVQRVSADIETGRGLSIVAALAAEHGGRCGFRQQASGKVVFATLKVTPVPDHVHSRELAGTGGAL
jgi:two-component sensor histidine kinase